MTTILAIDPGGKYAGLCYFIDGDLIDATVIRAEHARELGWLARRWTPGKPDVIVAELQQIYPTTINPNALLPLARTVGAITACIPAGRVLEPLPREWKGSVKKKIYTAQLLQGMPEADHKILARIKTKEERGHCIDAWGLARWAMTQAT